MLITWVCTSPCTVPVPTKPKIWPRHVVSKLVHLLSCLCSCLKSQLQIMEREHKLAAEMIDQNTMCRSHLRDPASLGCVFELVLDQVCEHIPRADGIAGDVSFLCHLKPNRLRQACTDRCQSAKPRLRAIMIPARIQDTGTGNAPGWRASTQHDVSTTAHSTNITQQDQA